MGPAWLLVVTVLAGCYAPTPSPGAPCSPEGDCPAGQQCSGGLCQLPGGTGIDAEASLDALTDDAPTDPTIDAPIDAAAPIAQWGTPVALPVAGSGTDPTLTADRLQLAFVRTVNGNEQIFFGTREQLDQPFAPALLDIVNSAQAERSPELTTTGLYFVTARDGDFDVYFARRFFGAWTPPQRVTELSDAVVDESDVAIAPDERTAVVVRRANGVYSFWRSTRPDVDSTWGPAVRLSDLELTTDISAPAITNDAQAIYFHAGMNRDLYVARRGSLGYSVPAPITELATMAREAAPHVDQAESVLTFERAGMLLEAPHL